jgi:hypothetical protein
MSQTELKKGEVWGHILGHVNSRKGEWKGRLGKRFSSGMICKIRSLKFILAFQRAQAIVNSHLTVILPLSSLKLLMERVENSRQCSFLINYY